MADLVIRNARIVDGTGAPARAGDLLIDGDRIAAEVAPGTAPAAAREIDAAGRVLMPGVVDVHTHYDGQVTWDPELGPSSWHGVTTVVTGNCGVGFAPVRPDRHRFLIELMEGVEDIPGSALSEGIDWSWESFPEYLDAVASMPRTIEIAAQLPHGALRAYVMGDRGARNEPATPDDAARMAGLAGEATRAGAVAFSTNRLPLHTSIHGEPVPGTFAADDELLAIARGVVEAGGRLLQAIPAGAMGEDEHAMLREVDLYRRLSLESGLAVNFTLAQAHAFPHQWREVLDAVERANAQGARLVPQVQGRPAGLFLGWDIFNPFRNSAAYRPLARLPLPERLVRLRDPDVRAQILAGVGPADPTMVIMRNSFESAFAMDDAPVFEPHPDDSIAGRAAREGRSCEELLYDVMCDLAESSTGRQTRMFHVFFSGYRGGCLDDLAEMMAHPDTVVGLADGGAHCSMICDASLPSFMLQHWVRERTRGPRLSLEDAVRMLTSEPADLYGFEDRGRIAPGLRADLNLVDLDRVTLELPEIVSDLPTGASRIVQRADGWVATLCAGRVTFRDGKPTGEHPGGLVRL